MIPKGVLLFSRNWKYNFPMRPIRAKPLWLGQGAGAGLLPTLPTQPAVATQPAAGPLPIPGPLPSDGYGDKDGTWLNQNGGQSFVVSHNHNPVTNQDCDYQDTYENWQKSGIWNQCDTNQAPGTVSQVIPPTPVDVPAATTTPATTPGATNPGTTTAPATTTVPPAAGGMPVQNPGIVPPDWGSQAQQLPNNTQINLPPPPAFFPAANAPAAPVAGAPATPQTPVQPPAAPSGPPTAALVAGGVGVVGIAAALFFGVFKR